MDNRHNQEAGLGTSSALQTASRDGVPVLLAESWVGNDWLWHGFSTRSGGVSRAYLADAKDVDDEAGELNLGFTPTDSAQNVRENRQRFVSAITGRRTTPLVAVRQVHSNLAVVVRAPSNGFAPDAIPEVDGIITNQPGLLLGIQTADCIPVLIADRTRRVVAGFHAGWRGTVERIVELGVATMRDEFGSDPADLMAAIGPGIGPCCYKVGAEVLNRFTEKFSYAPELFSETSVPGKSNGIEVCLDLVEANRRQLLAARLDEDAISIVGGCTGCHPELFYSHRASGGHAGRMMSVIGIR